MGPDFTLRGPDGQRYQLSKLRGHAIVLNFWATWCGPCRAEMPLMETQYGRFKDEEVLFLAVNQGEDIANVSQFVDQLNLTFPILLDPEMTVGNAYRVAAYPTTYFIDADGVIRSRVVGQMTQQILIDGIQRALGR